MKQLYTSFILLFFIQIVNAQVGFNKHEVTSFSDGLTISPLTVLAADIDNDGDMDMLSSSRDDDKVAWYENMDGLGNFGSQQVISVSGFDPVHISVADLDGDGDLDVLSASRRYGVGNIDPKIAWYENMDGLGNFGTEQIITTSVNGASYVSASDIDGDGDLDVLSASSSTSTGDNKIAWYENMDGSGNFGTQLVIASISSGNNFFREIHAEDMDGDGDIDVVAFLGLSVWMYENTDGEGTFSLVNNIFNFADSYRGFLTDIDDDGDIDILIADGSISLYTNNNDELGTFTYQNLPNTSGAKVVHAADLDNDGDKDIIAAGDTSLFWSENTDGQGTFNNYQTIVFNTSINYVFASISSADMDNDGDIDFQTASFFQDEIAWFENLGILGNEINGGVKLDLDANGCDANDLALSNVMITAINGDVGFSTFTLNNGSYQLPVNEGDFDVSITSALPNYYVSNPASQNVNFVELGNIETADFCLEPSASLNSLTISIYPTVNEPRPGFDTTYQIVYKNVGTTQLSGDVAFQFDDSKLQFLSASESISSQTSNTLTFDYANLNPFETRTIDLEFNVFAPPTTNIDDILNATATINPIPGDQTEGDNVFSLEQIVIGSYDPNDIACLEGDEILIEEADEYLHYLIRFQNTGTASAINVRVDNILDDKFDWTTMQLESLSHNGRVNIENGNNISFMFTNINLPDIANDEPNSHGYIAYKIKPRADVVLGDIFYNTADIFFDFNPPITTNTATTEIVEEQLSVTEFEKSDFKIFPNPANSELKIESNWLIESLNILDVNGRILNQFSLQASRSVTINISELQSGIYFLNIEAENKQQTIKFIKN